MRHSTKKNIITVVASGIMVLLMIIVVVNLSAPEAMDTEKIQQYDSAWDFWFVRGIITLISLLLLSIPLKIYHMKYMIEKFNHMERMMALKIQGDISKGKERPAVVYTSRNVAKVIDGQVILHTGNIKKESLVDFVKNVNKIGLSISKWKKHGLKQDEIEMILDHLRSVRLITERTPGKSSQWNRELATWQLIKYFPLTESDL